MRNFRKLARSPFLASLLSIAILLPSCTQFETPTQNFTGKELMRGILFGDGIVAETVPTIRRNFMLSNFIKPEDLGKVREIHDLILLNLEKNDPNIFEDFKNRVTSGNHLLVRQSLSDYSIRILEASKGYLPANMFSSVNEKGFVKLIKSSFDNSMSSEEVKEVLSDPNFKDDIDKYFTEYEKNKPGSTGASVENEDETTIGPAVAVVAAVVAAVIYGVVILEAAYFWTDVDVEWDDGVAVQLTPAEAEAEAVARKATGNSLLKDELVNSIAVTLKR